MHLNSYQSTQTPNPAHPYQYQCRQHYDNMPLPTTVASFLPPYDSKIILRPITSTPQEPFEQRFTYPRLRHYDAPCNNLPASPTASKATAQNRNANAKIFFSMPNPQVKCHHLLLIYTYVLTTKIPN